MTLHRIIFCLGLAFSLVSTTLVAAPQQDLQNTIYLDTKDGRITIALRPDIAPKHVAQIEALTKRGFYDGIVFHRVIDGIHGANRRSDGHRDGQVRSAQYSS